MDQSAHFYELLATHGCFLENGHWAYRGGKHGRLYIEKKKLFADTLATSVMCNSLATMLLPCGYNIEVVAGAANGGIIMAQGVAFQLSQIIGRNIPAVYCEKPTQPGIRRLYFEEGYAELVSGKRVLLVDDVFNEGTTLRELMWAVEEAKGKVAACAVICDRGVGELKIPHALKRAGIERIHSLTHVEVESWEAKDCPMCKAGQPMSAKYQRIWDSQYAERVW